MARGAQAISLSFLTHAPTPPGIPGGGISTAIIGTAKIVGLALVLAIPVGMFTALFLYERRGRLATAIRFGADVMTGVPSILIGIFRVHDLGPAAAPLLDHCSQLRPGGPDDAHHDPVDEEALRAVAVDLREAGIALGARQRREWLRSIVVRTALPGGVVSGNLLAAPPVGIGETAPLLFTVAAPTLAMTLLIYDQATQAFASAQQTAWATALVLLVIVLAFSIAARLIAWALNRHAR